MIAVVNALMLPIYLTPYNSAHVDAPKTLPIPLDIPHKPKNINAIYGWSKKTKVIKAKINGMFIKGINFRLENLSTKKPVANKVIKETIEYAMNDCAKTNVPQLLDSEIKD